MSKPKSRRKISASCMASVMIVSCSSETQARFLQARVAAEGKNCCVGSRKRAAASSTSRKHGKLAPQNGDPCTIAHGLPLERFFSKPICRASLAATASSGLAETAVSICAAVLPLKSGAPNCSAWNCLSIGKENMSVGSQGSCIIRCSFLSRT
jgi:hypothetical protein